MSQKYGPIFSLRLGTKLHVVVNTIDLVKVVARDLDQTFSNRDPPLTALSISYGGLDVGFSSHRHWRDMRKILVSQVLSTASLEASRSLRTNEVRRTVSDVYGRVGTEIDINKVAYDTEINVVTSMLWGCSKGVNVDGDDSISDVGDGFREVMYRIMELLAAPNISDFIPMLSRFDLQGRLREMQKQKEHMDRIFENVIRGRINANSRKMVKDERKDFLQILLDEKDDPTSSIDINQIKALLVDVMIATSDTTSTMVEWVMAELLSNPEVLIKVQEELTDLIVASFLHSFDWSLPKDEDFDLSEEFGIVMRKRKPLIAIPSPRLSDASLYL
ncbi:hypothetical protein L6452_31494 [Arctium lappa]|uniref:Uncharacterized protein n=2 Tax=Arctium lappa TaxID=4217 RepID=A0ACB8Z2B5_ARCLA|nr:hypothetical protein L6452_31491 [Arctium lappa]KAI3691692.1 hypothetical protein L6452_31494 [Arctium lappa]